MSPEGVFEFWVCFLNKGNVGALANHCNPAVVHRARRAGALPRHLTTHGFYPVAK